MKRFITIIMSLTIIFTAAPVLAAESNTNPEVENFEISGVIISPNDPAWPEFRWQRAHGAPPIKFWEKVAHCETRQDWQNSGTWAGGLGIYTRGHFPDGNGMGTWERWGGEQFAKHPSNATPLQQIVVANRIAMFGFEAKFRRWDGRQMRVRLKHYKKRPVGFNGWGCIKQRRNGSKYGTINPSKYEARRNRGLPVYMVHRIQLPDLNIPNYAWDRVPHSQLR